MALALSSISILDAPAQTANSPRIESTNPNLGVEFVSCTSNGSNVKIKVLVTNNHEFTKSRYYNNYRFGHAIRGREEFYFK